MLEVFICQLPLPDEILDQTLQYVCVCRNSALTTPFQVSSEDYSRTLLVCKQFFNIAKRIARTTVTCPITEPTCLDPTSPPSDEDIACRSRIFAIMENEDAAWKLRSLRILRRNLPGKAPNQIVTEAELEQRRRLTEYHSGRLYRSIGNARNLRELM